MDITRITTDELSRFAGSMIFQTDPYIYPALLMNEKNCIRVLKYLKDIKGELFSSDNICIFSEKNNSLGVISSYYKTFSSSYDNWCKAFCEAKVIIPGTFKTAYYDYVEILQKENHRGIYISNICVERKRRGQGVGRRMLSQFLLNKKETIISLDVLKDNRHAVDLYERLGFVIEGEYDGFSLNKIKPRCLHMTYYCQ